MFLRKKCSENMQQIYRKIPMPKCDFIKVALCSPVVLLHIFRRLFPTITYGGLLPNYEKSYPSVRPLMNAVFMTDVLMTF